LVQIILRTPLNILSKAVAKLRDVIAHLANSLELDFYSVNF